MARPNKIGLDYFPFDVDIETNDKISLIEAEFGIKGFGVVVKLFCKVYKSKGYYYEWNDKERILFAKRTGESVCLVDEIIKRSIKWGIFNESLFNQFRILTSSSIQEIYFEAITRRENTELIKEYALIPIKNNKKLVNVNIYSINDSINPINVNRSTQIKENKTKKNKTKKNNKAITPPVFEVFKDYALQNCTDVDLEKLELKFKSWKENNWKNGHDKPIKNWKTTLLNTLPYLKKEKSFAKKEKEATPNFEPVEMPKVDEQMKID